MITIVAKIRATNLLAASENVAGCVEPYEQTAEELGGGGAHSAAAAHSTAQRE